jgi:Cu-Zn family superoxide dismutase
MWNKWNKSSLLSRNLLLGCCAAALVACVSAEPDLVNGGAAALEKSENGDVTVSAELKDANGLRIGLATFRSDGEMMFVAISAELPAGHPSVHGLHLHANDNHENGDGCIADPTQPASTHFASADGHFNPGAAHHGDHIGDMPALFFTHNGQASMEFLTDRFSIDDILGRALVLHAFSDNYGNIPVGSEPNQYTPNSTAATELTQNTGNGGARIACGIIE